MTLDRSWHVVGHLLLLLLCLTILIPIFLVVGTSFKPPNEVFQPQPWPDNWTLANYRQAFTDMPLLAYLWNSVGTTSLRVAGQLVLAVITAYAFARYEFAGRETLFFIVLGALMIPQQLTIIPVYILIVDLEWYDTWLALIVPNLATPFGVFLLRQHFLAFPRELFDAAEMDGTNSWRTLWHIVIPNLGPAIAALTIILFIDTWNEYFWPLVVTDSDAAMTVQIGIRRYLDEEAGDQFGPLMAGLVIASIPAIAVFFVFQRRVLETFVASGLKG